MDNFNFALHPQGDIDENNENVSDNILAVFYRNGDPDGQERVKEIISELFLRANVSTQHNGLELLGMLEKSNIQPNIIVRGPDMPKKYGFDTLKALRESKDNNGIPIVIWSTSDNHEAIEYTWDLGASANHRSQHMYRRIPEFRQCSCLAADLLTQQLYP